MLNKFLCVLQAAATSSQVKKSVAADDEDMDPTVQIYYCSYISFVSNNSRMNTFTYPFLVVTNIYFITLQQYFENRIKYLSAQKADGRNPYPHKFFVSMTIPEYIEKYGSLSNGEHQEDVSVSLAGIHNCF